MKGRCPVTHLRSLSLETPVFDDCVAFYGRFLDRPAQPLQDGGSGVRFGNPADDVPMLELHRGAVPGIRSLTFGAASPAAVEQTAGHLRTRGVPVLSGPAAAAGPAGGTVEMAFEAPEGLRIILRADGSAPPALDERTGRTAERPGFLSHAVLNAADPGRLRDFFVDALGFTVTDWYEGGHLTFLQSDQPQHHCIGVTPGDRPGLHHVAFECGSIDGLMRSVGRMRQAGEEPIWGPGRHGPGGNVFCYYADPSGLVAEFTCELIQIADPGAWTAREWERMPDNANLWRTGGPSPEAIALFQGRGINRSPLP